MVHSLREAVGSLRNRVAFLRAGLMWLRGSVASLRGADGMLSHIATLLCGAAELLRIVAELLRGAAGLLRGAANLLRSTATLLRIAVECRRCSDALLRNAVYSVLEIGKCLRQAVMYSLAKEHGAGSDLTGTTACPNHAHQHWISCEATAIFWAFAILPEIACRFNGLLC